MRMLIFAWAVLLAQDAGVDEAAARLRESMAESEKLSEAILAQGPSALGALKRHAESASGAFREHLLALIREIERRERVGRFQTTPSTITLNAESAPLADVVSEIARQARISVKCGTAPGKDLVGVRLDRVPLLQALDELCRSHGGIVLRWPRRGPAAELTLDQAASGKPPRAFMGPYALEISSATWSQVSDFGVDVSERIALKFHLTWDPALQPMFSRLVITRWVEDGDGTVCEDVTPSLPPADQPWTSAPQQFDVEIRRRLSLDAKGFESISGYIETAFPRDVESHRIRDPGARREIPVKGGKTSFTFLELSRSNRKGSARFEAEPDVNLRPWDVRLVDRSGKAWPGTWVRSSRDEIKSVFVADFAVPKDVDVVELCVSRATPGPTVRTDWRIDRVRVR